ncbi:Transposable element Tcb1 transposase [Anthophora quadrimaculata]
MGITVGACYAAIKHIELHKTVDNVSRKQKPRKTDVHTDRVIHRISKADRFKTAVDIHTEISPYLKQEISVRTVQRRLNKVNLIGRVARKKPLISEKNRRARLQFAKVHIKWTAEEWSKVVFTDESKFNRFGSDGKCYVRRTAGEEYKKNCTKPTVKGGGGSALVWGSMSMNGTGPIRRITGIMDRFVYLDIVKNVLLPFAKDKMPNDWIYQADNDPKHTARVVKEFLEKEKLNIMKWPAQSPDLNPIEMLWIDVDHEIKRRKPKNIQDLFEMIEEAWKSIPVDRCIRLINSMQRRCAEVIKNKGYATKY